MPAKCCVPNCNSNYDSNPDKTYYSTFAFPRDESLKQKWIRAIHRDSFVPNKNSYVCCKHFPDTDIIREYRITNLDGSLLVCPRKIPKLVQDCVPSIFPNPALCLPKKVPIKRKHPEKRRLTIEHPDEFDLSEELSPEISGKESSSNIDNIQAVPTLFLSKGTENTVTEMSTQVDNNSCSNVPMETITEAEVKLEYDEESWRNNLLLENKPLPISVEPKVETCMTLRTEVKTEILGNLNNCIFDLFNQLWTCEYAPILPSRAWAIHFVESADSNVICLSKLIKISDNVVCEKKILINNNSIKLYVYGKLFEIGNLNLISSLICIESFQSILETFDNLKLSMNESNNSTSIYDFQHYGTNDYEQNIMPVLTSDIKVEPNIKVEPDIKVELECDV